VGIQQQHQRTTQCRRLRVGIQQQHQLTTQCRRLRLNQRQRLLPRKNHRRPRKNL
jgi:hypothetical protein